MISVYEIIFSSNCYQFDANLLSLYMAGERCTKLIAEDRGDWIFEFTDWVLFISLLVGAEFSPFAKLGIFPEFLETNAITVLPLFKSKNLILLALFPAATPEFLSIFSCEGILSTLIFWPLPSGVPFMDKSLWLFRVSNDVGENGFLIASTGDC